MVAKAEEKRSQGPASPDLQAMGNPTRTHCYQPTTFLPSARLPASILNRERFAHIPACDNLTRVHVVGKPSQPARQPAIAKDRRTDERLCGECQCREVHLVQTRDPSIH